MSDEFPISEHGIRVPTGADDPYVEPHAGDPDPNDPGFCRCGFGLQAWNHTDSTHYVATPLSDLGKP